jgi:tetratricopeptide (TPR) repeat protein
MPDTPVVPDLSPQSQKAGAASALQGGAGAAPSLPPLLEQPEMFVDSSRCWAPAVWLRWAMPGIVAVLVVNAFLAVRSTGANLAQYLTTMLLWAGCGFAVVMALRAQLRARLRERRAVEVAAEMIQRRRWAAAGMVLESVLARPMRAEPIRVRALTLLSMLLLRYERAEAALSVQDGLLSEDFADGLMVLTVKLTRAAALLREDRLFDADRAIADLRRGVSRLKRFVAERAEVLARARAAPGGGQPRPKRSGPGTDSADDASTDDPLAERDGDDDESLPDLVEAAQETILSPSDDQDIVAQATAALTLIEIYRDVKTGHPTDAIDAYRAKLPAMRDALGHRVADVHALAARALDLLNRPDEAAAAYERATLLAPAAELHHRYAELDPLLGRYKPAPAPPAIMELVPSAAISDILSGQAATAAAPSGAQDTQRSAQPQSQTGMIDAATGIKLLRRGILLGRLCMVGLFALAAALTVFGDDAPRWLGYRPDLSGILILLLAAWVVFIALQRRSARSASIVNGLLAVGATDAAEAQIAQVLRKGFMFGGPRAVAIYQLTLLRQTQQRWGDVAALSAALLNYRRIGRGPVAVPLRLLLASSSLELGDLKTARAALASLSTAPSRPLSLGERLRILALQLDFHRRIQAWGAVISALPAKLELAELMSAGDAARAQATMAMAAQGLGLAEWQAWLRRRAELLADPARLCATVPALSPLWTPRV